MKTRFNPFLRQTVLTLGTIVLTAIPGHAAGEYFDTDVAAGLVGGAVPEPTSALAGLLITAGLLRRRSD